MYKDGIADDVTERTGKMHEIVNLTYPAKKSIHAIQKECEKIADLNGDYKGQLSSKGVRFKDTVLKNRDEAERWIKLNDSGWYDNLAVKYKDGRKIMWLVKIEYHC